MRLKLIFIAALILFISCGFSNSSKEVKNLIKVYDYGVSTSNPVAILQNAYNIGYEKRINELWIAQFSLPADDAKNAYCVAFRYVEIFDNGERVDLFRILPLKFSKNADGKTKTYQCEHVLSTLLDDIMFQYHQTTGLTPTANISFILGHQSTVRWQVGTIDFTSVYDYKWENENLLSALFSLPKAYSGEYQWTWDTTATPWTLNLIQPSSIPTARIMSKKNLIDLTEDDDPTFIVTRLYPLGYGEGVNQLTIKSVNGGVPYIDASTIGTYGIIALPFIDKTEENAATLKAKAEAYLETIKNPRKTYEVDGADIYSITGDSLDRFRDPGIMVAVYDEDIVDFTARIVNVSKSDLTGNPGNIKIQISNKVLDSADNSANIQNRQRINDIYAQGATAIDSNDYQDNCDNIHPAVIKFYVPNECVAVNKCMLTYETDKFRAYETGAAAGGGDTSGQSQSGISTGLMSDLAPTVWSGIYTNFEGVHTHSLNDNSAGSHSHSVTDEAGTYTTSPAGSHAHGGFTSNGGSHSHELPDHTHLMAVHTHTLPLHTHDINYGIYKFVYLPTAVVIKVDGTTIPQTALSGSDIDIVPYLFSSGGKVSRGTFHTVEIYPNTTVDNPAGLARITASVIKQIFIQSRGGGNY